VKVVDVFDGGVKKLSIEKTAYGFITIKLDKEWGTSYIESLEECPKFEFEEEYNKFMEELAGVIQEVEE